MALSGSIVQTIRPAWLICAAMLGCGSSAVNVETAPPSYNLGESQSGTPNALSGLPRSVEFVTWTPDPQGILKEAGLRALVAETNWGSEWRDAGQDLMAIDLVAFDEWTTIGLEPQGIFGFAMLDQQNGLGCVFATPSDPMRLMQSIGAAADGTFELKAEQVKGGTIMVSPEREGYAIAINSVGAYWIVGPRAEEAAASMLGGFATSLGDDPDFQTATRTARADALVNVFITGDVLRRLMGFAPTAARLRSPLIDDVRALGLSISLVERRFVLRGTIAMPTDALMMDVLAPTADLSPLADAPVSLSLSLDPQNLGELVRAAEQLSGRPEMARDQLHSATGLRLDRETLARFTGAIRASVFDGSASATKAGPEHALSAPDARLQFDLALAETSSAAPLSSQLSGGQWFSQSGGLGVTAQDQWLSIHASDKSVSPIEGIAPQTLLDTPRPLVGAMRITPSFVVALDLPSTYSTSAIPDPSRPDETSPTSDKRALADIERSLHAAWERAERADAEHVLEAFRKFEVLTVIFERASSGVTLNGTLSFTDPTASELIQSLIEINHRQAAQVDAAMQEVKALEQERLEFINRQPQKR